MLLKSLRIGLNIAMLRALAVAVLCLSFAGLECLGQSASVEKIGRGATSSVAIDNAGDLHVVYLSSDAKVWYSYRPVNSARWFSVEIVDSTHSVQNIFPKITLDAGGRPHICVATGELKYISLLDGKWVTQVVDPGSGLLSYHCSIAISGDGSPHLTWYHELLPGGKQFTRIRHADLEGGVWVVRSVDGGVSGKWNSIALDAEGFAHISYSQISYGGALRYASWNGKTWDISDVDSSHGTSSVAGFDNSLALSPDGSEHISYFDDKSLKYAHRNKQKWMTETVASISPGYDHYAGSTTMLLDKSGSPHIIYSDIGEIKHAFRKDDKWQTESIVSGGIQQFPSVDATMGPDGTLYVTYPDLQDGYVKLATIKASDLGASSPREESPQK